MDDQLRTEKRATWMAQTSLKQRWIAAILLFVAIMVVFGLISLL